MEISCPGGKVKINQSDYNALQKFSNTNILRMISDQFGYWRLTNTIRLSKKVKKLCEKENLNPQKIGNKFMACYIDASSYEEDDDIQDIWAKLLIQESKNPNSISLRTLSTLKSLNKEEALAFKNLYSKAILFKDNIALINDRENGEIGDIIRLVDCGLLVSENSTIICTIKISPHSSTPICLSVSEKLTAIYFNENDDKEEECSIPIFSLTKAGEDILKSTIDLNDTTSFLDTVRIIKMKNHNADIRVFTVTSLDKKTDKITYRNENLLENKTYEHS